MKSKTPGKILAGLKELYPDAKSELNYANHYQLVIAVALSAQCTDKKVNETTPALFKKYPDFRALAKAQPAEIEPILRQVNYYKTKSANIIAAAKFVDQNFANKLPLNYDDLIKLPGVGRKTANVVLSELDIKPAIAVDTHVFRLSHRLGLSTGKNVLEVEKDLQKLFDPQDWRHLHHGLILHGRRVCAARKPLCSECTLAKLCPKIEV